MKRSRRLLRFSAGARAHVVNYDSPRGQMHYASTEDAASSEKKVRRGVDSRWQVNLDRIFFKMVGGRMRRPVGRCKEDTAAGTGAGLGFRAEWACGRVGEWMWGGARAWRWVKGMSGRVWGECISGDGLGARGRVGELSTSVEYIRGPIALLFDLYKSTDDPQILVSPQGEIHAVSVLSVVSL